MMRRLPRSVLVVGTALSLAIAMLSAATVACPETLDVAAPMAAEHDCDAPVPPSPATDRHDACRLLASCAPLGLAEVLVARVVLDPPAHRPPEARTDTPPPAIDRAPVAPPPRA